MKNHQNINKDLEKILKIYQTKSNKYVCIKDHYNHLSQIILKETGKNKYDLSFLQKFLDSIDPCDNEKYLRAGLIASHIINNFEEQHLDLDLTRLKNIYFLGYLIKDKKVMITGSSGDFSFSNAIRTTINASQEIGMQSGFRSENCYFSAKKIKTRAGERAKYSIFIADIIEELPGILSEFCRFESKKVMEIAQTQEGTSTYFVNGKEIEYFYHKNADINNRLIKHKKTKSQ